MIHRKSYNIIPSINIKIQLDITAIAASIVEHLFVPVHVGRSAERDHRTKDVTFKIG